MLGNGRLEAHCMDGVKRLCHIRGKMRKKVWVNAGDIVLVGLRDYQDEKADVILKCVQSGRNAKRRGTGRGRGGRGGGGERGMGGRGERGMGGEEEEVGRGGEEGSRSGDRRLCLDVSFLCVCLGFVVLTRVLHSFFL